MIGEKWMQATLVGIVLAASGASMVSAGEGAQCDREAQNSCEPPAEERPKRLTVVGSSDGGFLS